MKKYCIILGNRPDIIKFAPLILKLKNKTFVIHTGQHRDLAKKAFDSFDIKPPDVDLNLMKPNQDIFKFIVKAGNEIKKILFKNKFKIILVCGDTATAFAGTLAGYICKIPIAHIEAGLRTGDINNPYPEEFFRIMIDHMSSILFAPTKRAVENLKKEDISKNIYQVGNTIVDSLELIKKTLPNKSPLNEKYVLVTIHRRESFGKDIIEIFEALKKLSKEIKLVIPLHLNPNVQNAAKIVKIDIVPPMDYKTFLWHMKFCEYVISDSGGCSEEVASFKKKIAVIRKKTERPEVMEFGYGILIDKMDRNFIYQRIKYLEQMKVNIKKNPFGDGKSTDRIIKILEQL